ncbi:MAG: calcium/sodium antiporter [Rhodospirillales bacterium]
MYPQLVFGIVVLFGSAEVLIRGAVSLAKTYRVPPLVIGMTVIAVGTSAPELVVSVNAALTGAPGLALGNVIGSNIANVLLILGVSCMIASVGNPDNVHTRDGIILAAGSAVFVLLCAFGELGVGSGAILLVMFAGFLVSSYRLEAEDETLAAEHIEEVEEIQVLPWPVWTIALMVVAGLAGVIWGADLMVEAGVAIARAFDVPEEIIGLTLIAFGTSLPELAASVVAAYRGHADLAVGNVVGSNLFNILGIAGVAAMVTPLPVSARIFSVDLWVMLGSTALVLPILAGRWHPGRVAAVVFLVLYGAYIAFNVYDAGLMRLD